MQRQPVRCVPWPLIGQGITIMRITIMRTTTVALLCLLMSGGAAVAATGTTGTAAIHRTNANAVAPTGTTTAFPTESDAAKSCGASNVVWANTRSKAYHLAGDKYFGHTKHGAWMCMGTANAEGFHETGMTGRAKTKKG